MDSLGIAGLAGAASILGVVGGFGGAVVLVPLLVLAGTEPAAAGPLGLSAVAAGSLAAASRQIDEGIVNHRLGVTIEVAASGAALVGVVLAELAPERTLTVLLGVVAVAAGAGSGLRGRAVEQAEAEPVFAGETAGEWPGGLGGVYLERSGEPVPYQVRRMPLGLAAMALAGLTAGLSGTSGGYIKTPVMNRVMRVPLRVAAATTTFTVGFTASVGLLMHAAAGRFDVHDVSAVLAGALLGGWLGASVQGALPSWVLTKILGAALVVIGVALFLQS